MTQAQAAAIRPVRALARPRLLAIICIAVLAAAGWIYLGLMLAGMSGVSVLQALCRPSFGAASPTPRRPVFCWRCGAPWRLP